MAEEEANWEYDASEGEEKAGRSPRAVSWTASEYIDHKQGAGWFSLLALATLILAVIIYLITRDYFATGVIIVLGIIVGTFAHRAPRELHYKLSANGLSIEEKMYPLNQFKSFSLVTEGPICNLELTPLKRFMPPVSVYFAQADEKKIVALLENVLPYEERELDSIERLSRRLRF